MKSWVNVGVLWVSSSLALWAHAQTPIRIGEINSYSAMPQFTQPYKQGWQLAVEEINASGGLLGRKVEVIARDDDGREATALFQLFVGEQEKVSLPSRESFTEKLRMAGKRPFTIGRLSDVQTRLTARESMPHKVRAG